MKDILKKINKKEKVIIGIFLGVIVITLISIIVKDTHAFYNSETTPIQIFKAKIGNFAKQDIEEFLDEQKGGLETLANMNNRNDILRRYQGSSVNNYICFGTNNISDCTKNTDKYMYRIIGIDTITNELKIQKKDAFNHGNWHSTDGDYKWNQSQLYTDLNGALFLNNPEYVPSEWKDILVTHDWKYGDLTVTATQTGKDVLASEKTSLSSNINAKVGLIYISDYYLGVSNEGKCYQASDSCKTKNWMWLWNNDTNSPTKEYEWFMQRRTSNSAWYIQSTDRIGYGQGGLVFNLNIGVRPVFYISNEIKLTGKGTKEEPFIISSQKPIINDIKVTSDTGTSITVEVNAIDDVRVTEYCYKLNTESNYTCTDSNIHTFNGLDNKIYYTLEVYVKDGSNNGSNVFQKILRYMPIKDYLKEKDTKNTLQDNAVDGMYRYYGTSTQVTNNYICFGTDNTETCKGTPETYMYRIIGITDKEDNTINLPANSLKIIKATPTSESQRWHTSATLNVKWDQSAIKNYLNTNFLGTINTAWQNIISNHKWYIKDQESIGSIEPKDAQNISNESQIGLMYATDYVNAYKNLATDNWLYIKNDWSGNFYAEWTMTRVGFDSSNDYYHAWFIYYENGSVAHDFSVMLENVVRPVFYLEPYITLSGEGTKENPFIINL